MHCMWMLITCLAESNGSFAHAGTIVSAVFIFGALVLTTVLFRTIGES